MRNKTQEELDRLRKQLGQAAQLRTSLFTQAEELRSGGFAAEVEKLKLSVWDSPQWRYIKEAVLTGDLDTLAAMRQAVLISVYTSSEECVLIQGETGTGKELFARTFAVGKPFVAINCTSLPDYLIESELFGHKRGAFTGAIEDRLGLFQSASGGVLFIDEIGDMPSTMQPKLLRVLQERTIRRVGDNVEVPINCRVVVATHRNLEQAVESGGFRRDLYWRIATHTIAIKPLRERPKDVALFLSKHLGSSLVVPYENLNLKGNYRELQSLIARERLRKHAERAGTPPA